MLRKLLLQLEFSLAFAVPFMFLLYGLVFGPFLLVAGATTSDYLGVIAILVATVGGCLGLFATLQLLLLQIHPAATVANPTRLLVYVASGLVAIAVFAPLLKDLPWFVGVGMALPVPVVAHLVYLNRYYLFRSRDHVA